MTDEQTARARAEAGLSRYQVGDRVRLAPHLTEPPQRAPGLTGWLVDGEVTAVDVYPPEVSPTLYEVSWPGWAPQLCTADELISGGDPS